MLSNRDQKRLHYLLQFAFILSLILVFYFVFRYIFSTVAPFVIAFVTASVVEPLVLRLNHRYRLPRGIASVICLVLILAGLAVTGIVLSTSIFSEIKVLAEEIPRYFRTAAEGLKESVANREGVFSFLPAGASRSLLETVSNYNYGKLFTGSLGSLILDYAGEFVTSIPNTMIFLVVCIVSTLFTSSSFPKVKRFILAQFDPQKQSLIREIKKCFHLTLKQYVRSYALLMVITFGELFLFFAIFDFKPAFPLALLISVVDILPVLGIGTVLIPWAVICLLSGMPWRALLLLCFYVITTVVRQILEPKIIGAKTGLPPILTLLCVWVGLKLFGFGGMIALPITAVIIKSLHDTGKIKLWKKPEKTLIKENINGD